MAADRRLKILGMIEQCVCRDRMNVHGEAEDNFADIATLWNVLLKRKLAAPIGPLDVAMCMIAVKLSRMVTSPNSPDNWIDAGGYATCGGGIVLQRNGNGVPNPEDGH